MRTSGFVQTFCGLLDPKPRPEKDPASKLRTCGALRFLSGCELFRRPRLNRLRFIVSDRNTLSELLSAGRIGWQRHTLIQLCLLRVRQAREFSEHLDNTLTLSAAS